jgi:hypothetical protein
MHRQPISLFSSPFHSILLFFLGGGPSQDGEPVEYTTTVDFQGRVKAERVTGPMGAFVQGTPPPAPRSYDSGSGGYSDGGYDNRPQRNYRGEGGGRGGGGGRWGGDGGYQQRSPRRGEYQPPSSDNNFDTFDPLEEGEVKLRSGEGLHELDLPENDPDDNAEAEKESAGKDAGEPSASMKH